MINLKGLLSPQLTYEISGLKCDVQGCDFMDMSIKYKDYPKWLNAPCPKCGGNLLTEKDYRLTMRITRLIKLVNIFYLPIHIFRYIISSKYRSKSNELWVTRIDMDGTGKVTVNNPELIK